MTYEELCSFEVLYKAYLEARKGKRSKSKTIEYEAQALACTEKLSRKLAVCNVRQPDGSIRQQIRYVPSKFEVFAVYEPKRRMVHAPAFVDKVVLHALVDNILYDALTKSFIRDSHASQTGKGTDDGLMRLKTHMVDYYRREGHGADGWVLKGDVRHFFASIDHRKLKRKLKAVLDKRGVDPRVYELLCIYIDVMEDGLPLGYQTSQLFALMFLDEFDHIIKEKYRIKYYGRYMDDFYIICSDKKKLQCILRDVRALMDSYGLELNQKTAIFPLRNGIDFLGFHSYLTDTGAVIQKLRRDSSKRMKNKIKYWETAYPAGEATKQETCGALMRGMPTPPTAILILCAGSTRTGSKNCLSAKSLSIEKSTRTNLHVTDGGRGNAAASTRSGTKPCPSLYRRTRGLRRSCRGPERKQGGNNGKRKTGHKSRWQHCQNQGQRRVQRFYCRAAGQSEYQHL